MVATIGFKSQIRINTQIVFGQKWTLDVKASLVDATTFESNGFLQWVRTFVEADISIEGVLDTSNMFANGPTTQAGSQLVATQLFIGGLAGPFFLFPNVWVESFNVHADVKDANRFTLKLKSEGAWLYPVGVFPQ
jgi:hypothetical protein